jgi:hypothetical protein
MNLLDPEKLVIPVNPSHFNDTSIPVNNMDTYIPSKDSIPFESVIENDESISHPNSHNKSVNSSMNASKDSEVKGMGSTSDEMLVGMKEQEDKSQGSNSAGKAWYLLILLPFAATTSYLIYRKRNRKQES